MERFWNKVKKGEADECWPWQARKNNVGYGTFSPTHDTSVYAHRFAYSLTHGDIPDGMCVRHTCDNPVCCNPRHLLLGSHQDNMDDRAARGRQARGVTNGNHKLTEAQVRSIRTASGTMASIAKLFGVTRQTVNYIKRRLIWAHIE